MGRVWPLPPRRPFAVDYHPSPSATATATTTAAAAAATKGIRGPLPVSSHRSSCSPLPQTLKHKVVRGDSFQWQNQFPPYQQQLSHQQQGRTQRYVYKRHDLVPSGQQKQLFEKQRQRLNRERFSTVASHTQAARGSALPVGGAAGAAGGGVISLFRDGFSSRTSKGRIVTRSSLAPYNGVRRVSDSTQEYRRTRGRGSTVERGPLLKTASSGSRRVLCPAVSSPLARDETGILTTRCPTSTYEASNRSQRQAPPPTSAVQKAASNAPGNTATEWAAGAILWQTRRAGSKKNLRVSFAIDLPSKEQQQHATRGEGEEGGAVAANAGASAAVLREEERQFLLNGVGRTSTGSWGSKTAPGVAAATFPASASGGHNKPIPSGWKFSWPPALRRRRTKEAPSEVQAAAKEGKKLLLLSSPFNLHPPPHPAVAAAAAAGEVVGFVSPRGISGTAPASKKALTAPEAGGVVLDAAAEAGTQLTPAAQGAGTQGAKAPDTRAEAKARRSLLGLQRFRHRLPLLRSTAAGSLQQQQQQPHQQSGAVERLPPGRQLFHSPAPWGGGISTAARGGCSNGSTSGQPFAAAGIPSSLWLERELLPPASPSSRHEGAEVTRELVFGAEGGAAATATAACNSRVFWWREETRASRSVGCSKDWAAPWQLSNKERANTELQQQQPSLQRQEPHLVQPLCQQVLQQQQEQQYIQERQILQNQRFLQQQRSQELQQVREQIFSKRQDRVCWQVTREADVTRGPHGQQQQSVHQSKGRAEEAAFDAPETFSEVRQNYCFGFSFAFRQERRTFVAAEQQAACGRVSQQPVREAGQSEKQVQEQQVSERRVVPGQLKQGLQDQQRQRQRLPLQWEEDSQQLQRQESRLKRDERLERQLTVRRRVPSVRSSSLLRCAVSRECLNYRRTASLEDGVEFAAVSEKEGHERPGSSAPLEIAQSDCTHFWETPLAARSTSADVSGLRSAGDHVAAAARRPAVALYTAAVVPSAAGTVPSASVNSGADLEYSAARRSAGFVGFSAGATASADRLLHAARGSPTDSCDNILEASLGSRNNSFLREQGSLRYLRSCSAGARTPLPPVATAAAASPLMLWSATGNSSSRLPVAASGLPLPAVAAGTGTPPAPRSATAGVFAPVPGAGVPAVLRSPAAVSAGLAHKQAATAGLRQQRETARARAASRAVGRTVSAEGSGGIPAAKRASEAPGASVTAGPSLTARSAAALTDAPGTAKRVAAGTARGAVARGVSAGAQEDTALALVELLAKQRLQKQRQNLLNIHNRRQQQYASDENLYQQEQQGQWQGKRPEGVEGQLSRDRLVQGRETRVKQQQTEQRQEKTCLEKGFVTRVGEVLGAEPAPAAAGFAAAGAAVSTALSATAAARPPATPPREEDGGAAAITHTGQQKGTATEKQQAARRTEANLECETDSGEASVFGQNLGYHRSGISRLRSGRPRLNNSGSSTYATRTPFRNSTCSAVVNRKISKTPPDSSPLHSPRRRQKARAVSLQFVSFRRRASGYCRIPVLRKGTQGYEKQQQLQRRGSLHSNSNNDSNNSSSRRSTNSSRYGRGIRRSPSSTTGEDWGRRGTRFSFFSPLVFALRHPTRPAASKAEEFAAGKAAVQRQPTVAAAAAAVSKGAAEEVDRGGTAAAVRSGSHIVEAPARAPETIGGVNVPFRRRSSKLHAVFSSLAGAVRRGSSISRLTASTRKQKRQGSISVANKQGEAAASESHSSMASAGKPHEPLASVVSPMHPAEAQHTSPAPVRDPAAKPNKVADFQATADLTGEDSPAAGAGGEGVGAVSSAATAARRQTAETSSAGEHGRGGGCEGGEETHRGHERATERRSVARDSTAAQEKEDDSGVLTCYSLPLEEGAQGYGEPSPAEVSALLSLDSQNSSALSCHSLSSSSSSESSMQGIATADAAARTAAYQHPPAAERQREHRLQVETANNRHGNDEVGTAAEDKKQKVGEHYKGGRTVAAAVAHGEVEEMGREGSLPAAGDLGEIPTGEVPPVVRANEYAAASQVENPESVVQPEQEEYMEEEEDLTREERTRRQENARFCDLEEAAARQSGSAERAAQRASAVFTAAARAAGKLAAAERTATEREVQAERAATRAAVARQALIQAAAAAGNDLAESEMEPEECEEGELEGEKAEDADYSKIADAGRKSSIGSLRRRSTASSAGSAARVIVEAREGRLMRGKPEFPTQVKLQSRAEAAARESRVRRGEAAWTAGTAAPPKGSRDSVAEASRDAGVARVSEERHYTRENCGYVSPVPASSSEYREPAAAAGAAEERQSRASAAAAAARVAKQASAAAVAAEDAAAAIAKVTDARITEAYAADQAAEDAAAAADAVGEASEYNARRRQTEERPESGGSSDELDADISELKRYATEFLLEENTEEPDPGVTGGYQRREALHHRSSSVRRSRHQGASSHDGGAAAIRPQKEPSDISSGVPRERGPRQGSGVAGGKPQLRRRSQVLSREEELAAIAGEAPELIEEDEDGAAVLARKVAAESVVRRDSRRFVLTQPSGEGGTTVGTAAVASQNAPDVASETAAPDVGPGVTAPAAGDMAGAFAVDTAGAELAAPAAEHASAGAISRSKKQQRQQRRLGSQSIEQEGSRVMGKEGERGRGAAASTADRGDAGFATSEAGAAGPAGRRFSEAAPRQSWSSLAQVRKNSKAGDRRFAEKYEEMEAARRSREQEDSERNREEHQKETLRRRSTQEKHLVRRLLRHRTLQSPLLTVPPPVELRSSPVLQAVYSRGEGGAAEAVMKAEAERRKIREDR